MGLDKSTGVRQSQSGTPPPPRGPRRTAGTRVREPSRKIRGRHRPGSGRVPGLPGVDCDALPLSHPQGVVEQFADDRPDVHRVDVDRRQIRGASDRDRAGDPRVDRRRCFRHERGDVGTGTVDLYGSDGLESASTSEATLAAAFWISSVASLSSVSARHRPRRCDRPRDDREGIVYLVGGAGRDRPDGGGSTGLGQRLAVDHDLPVRSASRSERRTRVHEQARRRSPWSTPPSGVRWARGADFRSRCGSSAITAAPPSLRRRCTGRPTRSRQCRESTSRATSDGIPAENSTVRLRPRDRGG